MRSFEPGGHFLQSCNLTANHDVWFCYVHVHVGVGHLIGQSVTDDHRLVSVNNWAYVLSVMLTKTLHLSDAPPPVGVLDVVPALCCSIPALIPRSDPLIRTHRLW